MKLPGSKGEHEAQEAFGSTDRALAFYQKQMLNYLNPWMCQAIARQEMVFIASADAQGECDCSFRAGPPGFIHILDDKTLAYPEYRGNGVFASVGNIMENPHIGMIFVDFFHTTVGLHVNGKARVVDKEALLVRPGLKPETIHAIQATGGLRPHCWVLVAVEEAYIHCSKHVPRLQKLDKAIRWGTDDEKEKGGDAFKTETCSRPWSQEETKHATDD